MDIDGHSMIYLHLQYHIVCMYPCELYLLLALMIRNLYCNWYSSNTVRIKSYGRKADTTDTPEHEFMIVLCLDKAHDYQHSTSTSISGLHLISSSFHPISLTTSR